jgi:hypothetical protein
MSVFNRYTDSFTKVVTFKKHVISNVFWDDTIAVQQDLGHDKANKVAVYVPKDKNDLSNYVNAKQYNGNGWTLQTGDFIVKGEVIETEITGIKDLKNYDAFTIMEFDNKDYGSSNMHHFEIKGS